MVRWTTARSILYGFILGVIFSTSILSKPSSSSLPLPAVDLHGFVLEGTPAAKERLRTARSGKVKIVATGGVACNDSGTPASPLLIDPLRFHPKDCAKIFLDIGSNQGTQLRKLYDDYMPTSPWAQVFTKHFGQGTRSDVCSFAFEGDRMHQRRHEELHTSWKKRNLRTQTIFHPVWASETIMTFYEIQEEEVKNWGSTLNKVVKRSNCTSEVEVLTLDLARFMRLISEDSIVVAKMDIEGAEHVVLRELLLQGQLCNKFDFLGVEVHGRGTDLMGLRMLLREGPHALRKCKCDIRGFDDEST